MGSGVVRDENGGAGVLAAILLLSFAVGGCVWLAWDREEHVAEDKPCSVHVRVIPAVYDWEAE